MAVSKVVLGNETLIDLTGDSVSSENLLQGETAHGANGEEVIGGVVVTPMYTGTKAAIESAIAEGKIPEDAVVNITDDEETSSFQTQINEINSSLEALNTYSTEEKVVGTWVDGSKIYQKSFVDVNLNGLTHVDISSLSIKTVINIEAIGTFDNNSVGSLNYNDNNYVSFIWLNPEKTTLSVNEKNNKMLKATFTLKYTKK